MNMETIERKLPQSAIESTEKLVGASVVMKVLNVSRATAYRFMTDGTLAVYRFAGRGRHRMMVRVSLRDLLEWRESHKSQSASAA